MIFRRLNQTLSYAYHQSPSDPERDSETVGYTAEAGVWSVERYIISR